MMLRQFAIVSVLNFRNLRHRFWESLVIVIGMACVTGVLLSMLSMTEGLIDAFRRNVDPRTIIVVTRGSQWENASSIPRDHARIIMNVPGIAKAADTVGIKVNRTRLRATVLGGAVAGLGGAFFTVAAGLAFGKEMTNGKGYIALAAMILGRWSPKGALAAALLFGFANNLQLQLSIIQTPIPSQIMLMTPYIVTIFAVAGLVGRVRPPAAEGIPYTK